MREILFRGQTRKKGEKVRLDGSPIDSNWVYGGIFPNNEGGDFAIIYQQYPKIEKYTVYVDTVGQFTGLTDKNGRKIFEGDIIHLEYSQVFFGGEYFGEYTAEVSYKEGCFITNGINNGDEIETPLSGFDNDELEIIGNIHDNPEMLEVTK